jgi:hypothetical protein
MKESTYITKVLVPEEGHYITQAGEVDIMQRVLSKEVYLAVNDSPSNWKEITEEEANEIINEQNKQH